MLDWLVVFDEMQGPVQTGIPILTTNHLMYLTVIPITFSTSYRRSDSREEILKAFRLFDDDETGKISFRNLKRVAKELGENMTDEELQEMIDEVIPPSLFPFALISILSHNKLCYTSHCVLTYYSFCPTFVAPNWP